MMLSPCTATTPTARPISRRFHGAGNARIAATRTIVASTPLQPDSIDTAKPFAVLCSTLPVATTTGIEERDEPRADRGQRVGPRHDEVLLRPRRQLGTEKPGLQHEKVDEESDHALILRQFGRGRPPPVPAGARRARVNIRATDLAAPGTFGPRRQRSNASLPSASAMLFNSYEYLLWFLPATLVGFLPARPPAARRAGVAHARIARSSTAGGIRGTCR